MASNTEDHPLIADWLDGRPFGMSDILRPSAEQPHAESNQGIADGIEHLFPRDPKMSLTEARELLAAISPDCGYEEWIKCAMALKHQFSPEQADEAYELFDEWSSGGTKYGDRTETKAKWDSLAQSPIGRDPVTIRTLARMAKEGATPAKGFPAIIYGDEIANQEIVLPDELIVGMLHRGAKMVIGGGSKSFKTWCLADLALSIATGSPWWGREVRQGRVIYLNFEVQDAFFRKRLNIIAETKGVKLPRELAVWNLRGHCSDHRTLLPRLTKQLAGQDFAAIFLDPAYKLMHGSENAQEEVAALMDSIEKLGETTGAATVFGAHFAKGNAAGKEAIDRISGSGVFARDPDAILTMTRHKERDAFVIDPILRNCPPVDPFCVRWEFPLMRVADDLNPQELKQPMGKGTMTAEDLLSLVPMEGTVEKTGFIENAHKRHAFAKNAVRPLVAQLLEDERLFELRVKRSGKRDELHLARCAQAAG